MSSPGRAPASFTAPAHGSRLRCARPGIESTFVGGRRVTTAEALPVIREAFRRENSALCSEIGPRACGLMGDDLGLEAERLPEFGPGGDASAGRPGGALARCSRPTRVPVIAPLARGPLNVNADDAAAVLAVALGADRLVFVSDVPGVLVDGEVVRQLSELDISRLNGHLTRRHRPEAPGGRARRPRRRPRGRGPDVDRSLDIVPLLKVVTLLFEVCR